MRFQLVLPAVTAVATLALALAQPALAEGPHGGGGARAGGGAVHAGRVGGAGIAGRPAGGARASFQAPRSAAPGNASFARNNGPGGQGGIGRRGDGYGYGVAGAAVAGAALGFGLGYGPDYGYYDGGPDYADGGPYDAPYYGYGPGVQYGYDDSAPVQSGRSSAAAGDSCQTPVRTCTLYQPSYVGLGCSCKVPGGRAQGQVVP